MNFLIFDVWGDYAHFKKYYTTSSPLTFSIPPRTALVGLISAIIGLRTDEYFEIMTKKTAQIAVRIINPIKKVRISLNLINTKDNYWIPVKKGLHEPRTQVYFEFLKDPKFRIYFSHHSDIHNQLKKFLKDHKSVYTPYLGISELICDYQYVDEVEVKEKLSSREFLDIHTVVPIDEAAELDLLQPGKKYSKERIPTEILKGRIVTEYRDILYEINGGTIKGKVKDALKLTNNDIIVVL